MKANISRRWNRGVVLVAGVAALQWLVPSGWAQIPHYTNGMTGTFGSAGTWNFGVVAMTLDSTDDEYSIPFTAYESVTVDRAWQRFRQIDAGTTVQVGIMADDGGGNPSGSYLASGSLSFGAAGSFVSNINFSSSVSLTSGSVYHLVTRVTTLPASQNFGFYFGGGEEVRPYDRAADPEVGQVLRRFNGGAWGAVAGNGYFVLGNGTSIVAGPGQPYDANNNTARIETRGGTASAAGQQFVITDKEIAPDSWVALKDFDIKAITAGSPTSDLVLRFRSTNGTILASATLPLAQANGSVQTLQLDKQIELQQGVPYLLTSEYAGSSTLSHYYRFYALTAEGPPSLGAASWGGTNLSVPILSGSSGNWSTYSPNAARLDSDLWFTFQGIVVPEPSVTALLLIAGAALTRVRRSP